MPRRRRRSIRRHQPMRTNRVLTGLIPALAIAAAFGAGHGLAALPKGAPYLTAELVKIGDAIYVPRFAADGTTPTLLRVQSPADLTLLGVTDANYGQLVLDPAAWQQRYGVDPRRLPADE